MAWQARLSGGFGHAADQPDGAVPQPLYPRRHAVDLLHTVDGLRDLCLSRWRETQTIPMAAAAFRGDAAFAGLQRGRLHVHCHLWQLSHALLAAASDTGIAAR